MLSRLRHLLIGPPLTTQQLAHERLHKIRAAAAFSPHALSSIAYPVIATLKEIKLSPALVLESPFPMSHECGILLRKEGTQHGEE